MRIDSKLREWQIEVERLWSAGAPDWHAAARLVAAMANVGGEPVLRQAAAQALPILRSASVETADHDTAGAARRRLGVLRDVLHTLTAPQFGKRGIPEKGLTPEELHRQLLGLPLGRRLSGVEIRRAFINVAKTAHPDGGGSAQQFLEVSAARDALMGVK